MKYIVEYRIGGWPVVYMMDHSTWSPEFREASVFDSYNAAIRFAERQYPRHLARTWKHLSVVEFTNKEYFKRLLKG